MFIAYIGIERGYLFGCCEFVHSLHIGHNRIAVGKELFCYTAFTVHDRNASDCFF